MKYYQKSLLMHTSNSLWYIGNNCILSHRDNPLDVCLNLIVGMNNQCKSVALTILIDFAS